MYSVVSMLGGGGTRGNFLPTIPGKPGRVSASRERRESIGERG